MRACFIYAVCLVMALPVLGAGFKVGVGKVDITPGEAVRLAGYASRSKPFETIEAPLFVKALAVEDEGGAVTVIVTADTIGTPRWFNDALAERLEKELGVKRERFVFACSHTHSAPVIHGSLTAMYGLTEDEAKKTEAYTKLFLEKSFEAAAAAVKDLAAAKLSFAKGKATFAGNRRQFGPKGVGFGINPNGPVDHEVPVLKVEREDGTIKAVLFGYACHCTTPGATPEVSGDWAGYAQANLEQTYPGATALFITGCGADMNPNPRGSMLLARAHGLHLAGAVAAVLTAPMDPVEGKVTPVFERVTLPLGELPNREYYAAKLTDKAPAVQRYAQRHLEMLAKGEPLMKSYEAPVQVLRFGGSFTLVALSGEVVVDYALRLRRDLPKETLWTAGYCNDVFAYVPSMRILTEGGYEADFNLIYYSFPTRFAPAVEDTLVGRVVEMVKGTKK
ncbi:MAG TPA: neutral/alkaline non-lysosomal ceramidase N-terminal domain-containing protein [Prosthecobacter sp.]|nr:neutral/alkaline non-lysosomal ceramidase N-terminal domain-containing protein [Prosthecobacter sp.]